MKVFTNMLYLCGAEKLFWSCTIHVFEQIKNIDIKCIAYDVFLELPASGTLKIKSAIKMNLQVIVNKEKYVVLVTLSFENLTVII